MRFGGTRGSFTLSDDLIFHIDARGDHPYRAAQYMKVAPVIATKLDHAFEVVSEEGILHGEAGDYLAEGPAGELWSVKGDIFEETYKWVADIEPSKDEEPVQKLDRALALLTDLMVRVGTLEELINKESK